MNGEPFCYGSRLTVRQLLESRASGKDLTRLLIDHPELRVVGIAAAYTYAAEHRDRYADFFEADGSLAGPGYSRGGGRRLPAQYRLPGHRHQDLGAGAGTRRRLSTCRLARRSRGIVGRLAAMSIIARSRRAADPGHRRHHRRWPRVGLRGRLTRRPGLGGPGHRRPPRRSARSTGDPGSHRLPRGDGPALGPGLGPGRGGQPGRGHGLGRAALAFEVADIEARPGGEDAMVGAVQAYLAEHPDISGGLYLDNERGGIVTMLVTDDPDAHEAAVREEIGPDVPLAVRQVRWTEAELTDLQQRIVDGRAFLDAIPARMKTSSTDVIANQVELTISSAVPDAAARIIAQFGAEEGQLRVVSDGTGLLLLPTGRVEGRITAPPGVDVQSLSPQYEADVDIGGRDSIGSGCGRTAPSRSTTCRQPATASSCWRPWPSATARSRPRRSWCRPAPPRPWTWSTRSPESSR